MDWTPEIVDIARPLYESGMSAARIAVELSARRICSVSRNAVIGAAYRRGWTTTAPKQRMESSGTRLSRAVRQEPSRPSRVTFYPPRGRLLAAATQPAPLPQPPPVIIDFDDASIPLEQRRTVLSARLHDCRYPVEDPRPGRYFCGRAQKPDSSYCPEHHRRCHWHPTA